MAYIIKNFQDLTLEELYEILKLRSEVFVIEQRCMYQDLDDIDYKAIHIFQMNKEKCIAYARVYQKTRTVASFGRVALVKNNRGGGVGKALVEQAIELIKRTYNPNQIKIGAQVYLIKFYQNLGFEISSNEYDDEGIPHIDMRLRLT